MAELSDEPTCANAIKKLKALLRQVQQELPEDRGGPRPRDAAVGWLIAQLGSLFELYMDPANSTGSLVVDEADAPVKPWHKWVDAANGDEANHPFWGMVLLVCQRVDPPISADKAKDYIKEHLAWGHRAARIG
jgi:hypothetical protein